MMIWIAWLICRRLCGGIKLGNDDDFTENDNGIKMIEICIERGLIISNAFLWHNNP